MKPNSIMDVCVVYRATDLQGSPGGQGFLWTTDGTPLVSPYLKVTTSPANLSISGGQSVVVDYKVQAGPNATAYGFYRLEMIGGCVYVPFAVIKDANTTMIGSGDFPGFWNSCISSGPAIFSKIVGYTGANVAYLTNETRTIPNPKVDISGISVSSFATSQGAENVTFRMNVQSFAYPLTIGLDVNNSDVRVTYGNPQWYTLNDSCSWDGSNETALGTMVPTSFAKLPTGYMITSAPVLNLGTDSNSTYSVSLLISGPIANYTALQVFVYVDVHGYQQLGAGLATDFPVSISGKLQTISGPCV